MGKFSLARSSGILDQLRGRASPVSSPTGRSACANPSGGATFAASCPQDGSTEPADRLARPAPLGFFAPAT